MNNKFLVELAQLNNLKVMIEVKDDGNLEVTYDPLTTSFTEKEIENEVNSFLENLLRNVYDF